MMIDHPEIAHELCEILDTAIAAQHADFGNVQVYDHQSRALRIVAHRGFDARFLEYFREVRHDEGCACARAVSGSRVVVEDVEVDPDFAPHREIARVSGFRAVQSTPITSADGGLLGVLSTHFRHPQVPSPTSLIETDVCARIAARLIDRHRSPNGQSSGAGAPQLTASKVLHQALISLLQSSQDGPRARRSGFSTPISSQLQQATFSYAVSKRADGALPEAMIVELKGVLRQVDNAVPEELRLKLTADMVRWSIGAYYGVETDVTE